MDDKETCVNCGNTIIEDDLQDLGVETRDEKLCADCIVDRDAWELRLPEATDWRRTSK